MLSPKELLDEYFVENRNRLLEIAAFLDRLERASLERDRLDRADPSQRDSDFRHRALTAAIASLAGNTSNHVEKIQMLLSDPTSDPLPALDRKSAIGAYDRWSQEASQ